MANKTEYKVISAMHVEDLLEQLNSKELEYWRIIATIQEHAFTKIILEREY